MEETNIFFHLFVVSSTFPFHFIPLGTRCQWDTLPMANDCSQAFQRCRRDANPSWVESLWPNLRGSAPYIWSLPDVSMVSIHIYIYILNIYIYIYTLYIYIYVHTIYGQACSPIPVVVMVPVLVMDFSPRPPVEMGKVSWSSSIFVRMYVCTCVCMHACRYVCMYVCMHACMYVLATARHLSATLIDLLLYLHRHLRIIIKSSLVLAHLHRRLVLH